MTPLINGVNYAWGNIAVMLFGVPLVGIVAIDYNNKQTKENNYGAGNQPVSRGYGNKEYEGSIEIYTDELKRIIAAQPGRDLLDIPPFNIEVVFGGLNVTPEKDILKACEFMENPFTSKQGDTKITVKIPLIIGSIER